MISVMVVCFNSAPTLPLALASLLAQTEPDWECVFVDDGSTDKSYDVAASLGDSRIRAYRLSSNYGRGAARQFALEQARGDYLCMLDADDWMYPWRLRAELDVLERAPHVSLVSGGMAVVDASGNLTGVRGAADGDSPRLYPPLRHVQMPPLAFPAAMIRTDVAKACRFDASFRAAEDADHLLRILLQHEFCILNRNIYAYKEDVTVSLDRLLTDNRFVMQMFRKYYAQFPVQSRMNNAQRVMKSIGYRSAFAVGCSESLVRRRNIVPTACETEEFHQARNAVASTLQRAFPLYAPC